MMTEMDRLLEEEYKRELDRLADELLEALLREQITAEQARSALAMRVMLKHMHKIPLVNAETDETRTVETGPMGSAYDKYGGLVLLSDGEWGVDWDMFAKMLDEPGAEERFGRLVPRIEQEVKDTIERSLERKRRAIEREAPMGGILVSVVRWMRKAVNSLIQQ